VSARLGTPDCGLKPFVSHSQAGQDQWVYDLLVEPEQLFDGTFLDIGSNDPVKLNNTYALEQLGWHGFLVDAVTDYWDATYRERNSPFILADARSIQWHGVLRNYAPGVFDYLSLDVDAATLGALVNLLEAGVRWRTATIEHDAYLVGDRPRKAIREEMKAHGYTLVRADVEVVCPDGVRRPFEDWWVDLKRVPQAEMVK
jgi:hypothetical protein